MATLSAISKFLACYTWGRRGRGQEQGGCQVSQAGTIRFVFVFLPILVWNGVNSQSKSNESQYENKNRHNETERHRGNIDSQR